MGDRTGRFTEGCRALVTCTADNGCNNDSSEAARMGTESVESGLVGAKVTVTLEVEAEIPSGAPDHDVRTVTENSRTLKFTSQGFEKE
jgi:hypothetical protein